MRKQQFQILIGNFVYLFAQWAITVLVVKLSHDYYSAGLLGLAMTITNIFYIISSYGLRLYQVSDVNHEYDDNIYIISRMITVPVAIVLCVGYSVIIGYSGESILVIILFMLYKSFEAASDVFHGILQNNGRYDRICISLCFKGILSLLIFTLIFKNGSKLSTALLGILIVSVIVLVFDYYWSHKYIKTNNDSVKISIAVRNLLINTSPMVVLSFSSPLLMSIPRLYFERSYSTELLGIYTSLSSPTLIITTFVSCAVSPYLHLLAKYYIEKDKNSFLKLSFFMIACTIMLGATVYFICLKIGKELLLILYNSYICEYSNVFKLVIIVSALSSVNICMMSIYTSIRHIIPEALVLLTGCLLCYVVTPYFVDKFAMAGVAIALIISLLYQIIISACLMIYYVRHDKVFEILEK